MSDYIPFDIQAQIMKYLTVKSLVQFRSVSKQWKSLIDSSEFISNHSPPKPEPQHLFVSYTDSEENKRKYVSFLDDNSFPKHKLYPTVPVSVSQFKNPKVIGISKGLVCLYSYTGEPSVSGTVILWNPTVGKSVIINVPNVLYQPYKTVIGFAVCPRTNDPKLLKSTFFDSRLDFDSCSAWQVEVFSLSSNVWRTLSINLPDKSIALKGNQEVIDAVIYWLSFDKVMVNNVRQCHYLIMSFDITTEEFTRIDLPGCLSLDFLYAVISLSLSELRNSLVVIDDVPHHTEIGYDIWIMEDGFPKTFTKLFNINPPLGIQNVFGFLKSGASIVSVFIDSDDYDNKEPGHGAFFVYVPYSKHIDSIGISGNVYSFCVNFYTKSLLLLDQ